MSRILLVDDDVELTELLAEVLRFSGFDVDVANNGQEALDKLDSSYQLVLLDVMMPVLNGIETLKQIRQKSQVPVMMLTARGEDIDRVLGLELGADDYLPKPFNDRELIARIKAILRRTEQQSPFAGHASKVPDRLFDEGTIKFGGLKLLTGHQQAFYNGSDLNLTGTEFALLQKLACSQGRVISREELSYEVLGKKLMAADRTIDMHMSNLRRKLPLREDGTPWLKTMRGSGYLLVTE